MRFAIITAVAEETEAVLSQGGFKKVIGKKGVAEVYRLDGSDRAYLLQTGTGPLYAAGVVSFAIAELELTHLVGIGLCGGLTEDIEIGDAVIAESIFPHDSFISTSSGKTYPIRPGMQSLNSKPSQEFDVSCSLAFNHQLKNLLVTFGHKIHSGVIASGSEFVCNVDRKRAIGLGKSAPIAVDMESAGLAIAARLHSVTFTTIRVCSDLYCPKGKTVYGDFAANISSALKGVSAISSLIIGGLEQSGTTEFKI